MGGRVQLLWGLRAAGKIHTRQLGSVQDVLSKKQLLVAEKDLVRPLNPKGSASQGGLEVKNVVASGVSAAGFAGSLKGGKRKRKWR